MVWCGKVRPQLTGTVNAVCNQEKTTAVRISLFDAPWGLGGRFIFFLFFPFCFLSLRLSLLSRPKLVVHEFVNQCICLASPVCLPASIHA